MDTAVAIRDCCADWGLNGMAGSHVHPRPRPFSPIDQDGFFLRKASTNLINSMVPSQSLVVAGLKPFFWPSERRSNAALSFVGASKNAFAIAAFRSSGRSEL